jgi:GT2 family glycosyltransferase
MSKVYVVIVNYQNWKDTLECLQSLFCSTYDQFKVFVVDNASTNDSLQQLRSNIHKDDNRFSKAVDSVELTGKEFSAVRDIDQLPDLVFIQHGKNKGFASGNNGVLQKLREENGYIWLLNPDMTVEENTMSALAHFAEQHDKRSIIGSVIKFHEEPGKVYSYGGAKVNFNTATVDFITKPEEHSAIDFITGGSLFVYASAFKEVGLLPENYFLYWEETDWCYHAKSIGYRLVVCPGAICYDKVSTTIGRSFMADYYYTRNGLLFTSKYKKEKVPVALFMTLLRMFKRIMGGQWKRSYGVYKGMLAFLKRAK